MAKKADRKAAAKRTKGAIADRPKHESNGPALARAKGETMLTDELRDQIVRLIQAGNYAEVAADAVGIARATFYDWLKRGARGDEKYKALADAVKKAAAQSEARDVAITGKAAETQWQAAAWRLERKHFARWGKKDGLQITGDASKPLVVATIKWGDGDKDEIDFE
jgi:hypothetical protein